ncbi:MAG: hypothetical protein CMI74_08685 [Candidatus Pelagibacter sp.]|nr:hypothetical protein [Candidatus Pelagibacter sp.]|tara:strand:- start:155 stop:502 length:348 start_codon:yes stop_codon:yes gene_type:complete
MSKVLDNIKGHFKNKLNGELLKTTVPEWKTDIYYKPVYSFAVESKIIELQTQGKTVEALVESIVNKALDPDGKPMFHKFDKVTLMNEADPQVLIRVATALNNATSEYKFEDVEKN